MQTILHRGAMSSADSTSQPVEALYHDHSSWLRGWLRVRLGNAWDAADLAHDTYLRILRADTRPATADARRYLTQIANGLLVDLFRRRGIEAAYLDELALLPEQQAPSEEARALVLEALVLLDRVLNGLPAKARRALLLCKLDGMSYREIGDELGVSVSSVEKYMATALQACCLALVNDAA